MLKDTHRVSSRIVRPSPYNHSRSREVADLSVIAEAFAPPLLAFLGQTGTDKTPRKQPAS